MNSFNELSGVPATGNRFLVKQILRSEWGWDGVIVSDWGSVAEMIPHGVAEDKKQAALLAVKNECDIDMEGGCYPSSLEELVKEGKLEPQDITEEMMSDHMYTAGQKDPDFILRPSGEKRLSNFMLWQAAYAELVEMDVLWPDFTRDDLDAAITEFNKRSRRFGGI